jgi:class 3 adenylate cyclase
METVETRKLAAIMFTDIAGFSRQMGANEAHALRFSKFTISSCSRPRPRTDDVRSCFF